MHKNCSTKKINMTNIDDIYNNMITKIIKITHQSKKQYDHKTDMHMASYHDYIKMQTCFCKSLNFTGYLMIPLQDTDTL